MKRLLLILALLSAQAWPSCTLRHAIETNAACGSSNATCAVTVASTTAGDGAVALIDINISNTITGVSDGTSTWSLCPASECHSALPAAKQTDAGYTLSIAGGKTTVTVTRSSTTTATWRAAVLRYNCSGTPLTYDKGGNAAQTTNSTSPVGPTLATTGSSGFVVQWIFGTTPTAISGANYTQPASFTGNFGFAGAITSYGGGAQTWTQSNGTAGMSAIAISETPSGCVPSLMLMGVGRC